MTRREKVKAIHREQRQRKKRRQFYIPQKSSKVTVSLGGGLKQFAKSAIASVASALTLSQKKG